MLAILIAIALTCVRTPLVSSERANPKPDVRDKIISHLRKHMAEAFNISSGTKTKESLKKKGSSDFIKGGNGSDHSLFLSPRMVENLEKLGEEISNVTKPSTTISVQSTKSGNLIGVKQMENATVTLEAKEPLSLRRKIWIDPFLSGDQLKRPILTSATSEATQSATTEMVNNKKLVSRIRRNNEGVIQMLTVKPKTSHAAIIREEESNHQSKNGLLRSRQRSKKNESLATGKVASSIGSLDVTVSQVQDDPKSTAAQVTPAVTEKVANNKKFASRPKNRRKGREENHISTVKPKASQATGKSDMENNQFKNVLLKSGLRSMGNDAVAKGKEASRRSPNATFSRKKLDPKSKSAPLTPSKDNQRNLQDDVISLTTSAKAPLIRYMFAFRNRDPGANGTINLGKEFNNLDEINKAIANLN